MKGVFVDRAPTDELQASAPIAERVTGATGTVSGSIRVASRVHSGVNSAAGKTARVMMGSGTLRAAVVYGSAGVGFALANLLFARVLDPHEYGTIALVIALFNVSIPIAPLGVDGIVLRRQLMLDRKMLVRVASSSVLMAAIVLLFALTYYHLGLAIALLAFVAVATGGISVAAAAYFQSTRRRGLALLVSQGVNVVMLVLAVIVVVSGQHNAVLPIAGMMVFYMFGAMFLWVVGFREARAHPDFGKPVPPFPTREALAYAGVVGATFGLVQLERLVLPPLLGLEALAVFGVLAAIVGSVFRVLLLAVGFTLVPDLRSARTIAKRRRVVLRESLAVGAVLLATTVALWYMTPLVVHFFVGDKYVLAPLLIAASLAAGWFKVFSSFGRSSVTALATPRQLALFNYAGWMSVAISLVGAFIGARWGLTGVVWGMGAGWLALGLVAVWFSVPYFRSSATVESRTVQPDAPAIEQAAIND